MDSQMEIQRLREKVAMLEAQLEVARVMVDSSLALGRTRGAEDCATDQFFFCIISWQGGQAGAGNGVDGTEGGGGEAKRAEGQEAGEVLSRLEIARYGRQLIIPEIGIAGQRRLKQTSVLVVGAGGLGAPVAMYLASCGIGE